MNPRIGIFTRPIDQKTSGSGSHLREIVQTMLELAPSIDLVFCHYEPNDEFEGYRRAEELILPRNPLAASKKLRSAGLDIVHYNPLTIYSPLFVGDGTKRVATIHGAAPVFLPEQYSLVKTLHERSVVPAFARRMDHLFAVSETTKRLVVEDFGVPAERVNVIYNAVDNGFKPLSQTALEESRFAGIKPFVFHLSKFSERKNPWTILRAFAELARGDVSLRLVLGGTGWNNSDVLAFLDARELRDRAVFPGFLSKDEVVELMNLADVFVFPSYYEGFGMPNLEAMACGCPVVTSRAFAIPEIVGDAAVTLSDPTDVQALAEAVDNIRSDTSLREVLIERGFRRARAFSWEHSVETILDAYANLLGEDLR